MQSQRFPSAESHPPIGETRLARSVEALLASIDAFKLERAENRPARAFLVATQVKKRAATVRDTVS